LDAMAQIGHDSSAAAFDEKRLARPEDWAALDDFDTDAVLADMTSAVEESLREAKEEIERERAAKKAAKKAAKAAAAEAATAAGGKPLLTEVPGGSGGSTPASAASRGAPANDDLSGID
jgi:septal ring factor EnvC (AmiA/AmiB activator)